MGQFSWITQDTKEAIRESYGCDDADETTAYLHDNKGNVWGETRYEGYGVFGGKDFYSLVAEMNGYEDLVDEDEKRDKGIDIAHGKDPYISPNLTRCVDWEWINRAPEMDPNQGWGGDDYD
jgi:hypothetical protein